MARVLVTGTFQVEWDTDEFRKEWNEPEMTDQDIAIECRNSVADNWAMYACDPDAYSLDFDLIP